MTREATTAAHEGARVADESSRQSEAGLAGLRKILTGIDETTTLVTEISRATDEQLVAGKHVTDAITITAAQAKQVAAVMLALFLAVLSWVYFRLTNRWSTS